MKPLTLEQIREVLNKTADGVGSSAPPPALSALAQAVYDALPEVQRIPKEEHDDEVMGRGARLRQFSERLGVPVKQLGGGLIALDMKAISAKLDAKRGDAP